MNRFQMILLGIKVMFGRYQVDRYYLHPVYNPSEVTLKHKAFCDRKRRIIL